MKTACLGLLLLAGCVRNVNAGREQELRIDESSERDLGVRGCQEALAHAAVSTDPAETEPVSRVGKRIAAVVNKSGYRWEFHVLVDDASAAAWCLPGGKVGVHTGLFPALQDEAGAAFVMAHLAAHALLRHGAERIGQELTKEEIAQLSVAALGGVDPAPHRRALGGYGLALEGAVPPAYGPEHESEADRLGLEIMAKAGFDPRQAIEAWGRVEKLAPALLALHPSHPMRLKNLESRRPTAMALYDQAIKAPVAPLPKTGERKARPGAVAASAGSIVANAAGTLRTKSKENRHAVLFEFWLNQDAWLESVRVAGPDGLSLPLDARVGIPANLKKQAVLVRPDTGSGDFPGGTYTFTLSGAAGGRTFSTACVFEVR